LTDGHFNLADLIGPLLFVNLQTRRVGRHQPRTACRGASRRDFAS